VNTICGKFIYFVTQVYGERMTYKYVVYSEKVFEGMRMETSPVFYSFSVENRKFYALVVLHVYSISFDGKVVEWRIAEPADPFPDTIAMKMKKLQEYIKKKYPDAIHGKIEVEEENK